MSRRLKILRLKAEMAWLKLKMKRKQLERKWYDWRLKTLDRQITVLESHRFMEDDDE